MGQIKAFLKEEDGVGVVEIILILVVLISLVLIFKSQLTSLVTSIFGKIVSQSGISMRMVHHEKRTAWHGSVTVFFSLTGVLILCLLLAGSGDCKDSGGKGANGEVWKGWQNFSDYWRNMRKIFWKSLKSLHLTVQVGAAVFRFRNPRGDCGII